MATLGERLHSAPFVRLLVPFIAGIVLAEWLLPEKNWIYLLLPVILTPLVFFFKKCSCKHDLIVGALLLLIFLSLGFTLGVNLRYVPEKLIGEKYFAVLDEFPVDKGKSFRAVIRLIKPEIKVLAYFEKSEEIALAKPGALFHFMASPELITNQGNPFEFDYKKYSIRNKIGHRVYLKIGGYHFLPSEQILNLQDRALILRQRLLGSLSRNGVKGETFKVISGITFGARDNLDPETTQSFIRTGTIHVLAVSGGNVAVIYILLNFLLRFLNRHKVGIVLHTLILVSGIWGYALITGLSPSVLRAATMFTFIVIGNNISRQPNVYNSLAASAFILLCFNPENLYDVGFQLSYAAVFSIVFMQPVLYKSFYLNNWILDKAWLLLSVSLAAQIGTLPFSLYYFHQFPTYFWLSNLIVVPLVTLLLYLTLLIIAIIPFIPLLGLMMAHFLNWIGDKMLQFLEFVEKLPFAVIENIYPSVSELLSISMFFILTALFIIYKKGKFAILALGALIMMLLINNISLYNTLSRKEIVLFNIPGKTLIAFTIGRQTTWLTTEKQGSFERLSYFTKPYKGFRKIKKETMIILSDTTSQSNSSLRIKNNFISFSGLNLFLLSNDQIPYEKFNGFPQTVVFLLTGNSIPRTTSPQFISSKSLNLTTCSPAAFYTEGILFNNLNKIGNFNANNAGAVKITIGAVNDGSNVKFNIDYFDH